jgi:hypothetical protein
MYGRRATDERRGKVSRMSQPGERPSQGQMPVLDTKVAFTRLYADPRLIAYRSSIPLNEVEWVGYHVNRRYMRGMFGIGKDVFDDRFRFQAGRYRPHAKPLAVVSVEWTTWHGNDQPQAWTFLVNLSRQYLEPRLVNELAGRVRRGETVDVGGLAVNQGGVHGHGFSLPGQLIAGTRLYGGMVWVYQTGLAEPVLSVPQENPNAVLIPALFEALR